MATNSGVNVLRYCALFGGIGYGISHQNFIYTQTRLHKVAVENEKHAKLVDQAKAEWIKKTRPSAPDGGVITDPEDPNFDLEKLLVSVAEQTP